MSEKEHCCHKWENIRPSLPQICAENCNGLLVKGRKKKEEGKKGGEKEI
jgi:hypothetical protein